MGANIFIATPCFGGLVTQSYMLSVIGCMAEAASMDFTMTLSMLGNDALITRARNTLLHQFMSVPHATHIIFIDSDIGFRAADIQALLLADKPVIGALYPLKDRYWDDATMRLQAGGEAIGTASLRYVGDCAAIYDQDPGAPLAQVAYAGTGFLMIRRDCVAAMIAAYPETAYSRIDAPDPTPGTDAISPHALFDCMIDPVTRTYLSEDFAFCARWRAIGGEIWVNRALRLTHTGPAGFRGDPMSRTHPA